MGKIKRREEKLKDRERISKARVSARRKLLREEAKKQRLIARQEKELGEKAQPFVNTDKREQYAAQRDAVIQNKMERNLAALEAIVAEMDKEEEDRKSLNDKLEDLGHTTIEEKVRALAEMSQAMSDSLAVESAEVGTTDTEEN